MKILRFKSLADKGINYSRQHIDRLEKQGRFPQRRRLGNNSVGWVESEVDEFLRDLPRGFGDPKRKRTEQAQVDEAA